MFCVFQYTYRDSAKRDIQEAFKMYTDFRPTLEPFGMYLLYVHPLCGGA